MSIKTDYRNDPRDIMGMADILIEADEDVDIDEIQKSIIDGIPTRKSEVQQDIVKNFDRELDSIGRQFNVGGFSSDVNTWMPKESSSSSNSNSTKYKSAFGDSNPFSAPADDDVELEVNDADADDEDDNDNDGPTSNYDAPGSGSGSRDTQFNQMTNEEMRQRHVNKVLAGMDRVDDDSNFIRQEEEEDEMAKILEQIDLLRTTLESEGMDISRVPEVSHTSSKKEITAVLKILQIKNDRLRYCDMFEEGILAMAYGLEGVFDGKKDFFGTKIDLVGWPETVKVKLRRMRYDTSSFVADVMKGYSISHGWRILFELLPSLFLYSRDRRLRTGDNLMSDDKYRDAIRDLNR